MRSPPSSGSARPEPGASTQSRRPNLNPTLARRHRILIVEDDPASRLMATRALENDGFLVEQAETAEKALHLIAGRAPDLILMDIQLPGMDGLDLTRLLKADPATAKIPVLALTAYSMPLHQRAAMAAGCDGLIAKPVSPMELAAEVRAHVTQVKP